MAEAIEPRAVLGERLGRIRDVIARAAERGGRDPAGVRIVGASKTVDVERIRWAVDAGLDDLGENYVKELRAKRDAVPGATWHFLGTLQSHTAHHVAVLADLVHTLEPGRAAERLSTRAAALGRRIPALIEVDFTGERTGVAPGEVLPFADVVAGYEGLALAGLMTLPPMPAAPDDARPYFVRLRELRDALLERHPGARELSMGMSLDYAVAVEEGATMVRIGTALFGERPT